MSIPAKSRSGTVRVVSKRKGGIEPTAGERIIDVDRTHPVLGNQHILHNYRDKDERRQVIDAYARDFEADVAAAGPMLQEVERLATKVKLGERIALRCWCAPMECHAEMLAAKIAELADIKFDIVRNTRAGKKPVLKQADLFG